MHWSANGGKQGYVTIFFGLSGPVKTIFSTDPDRALAGDDEHGRDIGRIFNFKSGCDAKCIKLSKKSEPDIYNALKRHTLLENLIVQPDGTIDFNEESKTENTTIEQRKSKVRRLWSEDLIS